MVDATINGVDTLHMIEAKHVVSRGDARVLSQRVEMMKTYLKTLRDNPEVSAKLDGNKRKKLQDQHDALLRRVNHTVIGVLGGVGWKDKTLDGAKSLNLLRLIVKGDTMCLEKDF